MAYELSGSIKDMSIDFRTGNAVLTLTINEKQSAMNMFDDLNTVEKLSIKIDKFREKRSLNANALCWKMCTEIANILRSDKDSVYLEMLKRYGQSEIISVLSTIDVSGYFKYYDVFGTGYVKGKEFTHYKVYKGSSEYDTREMSILLDGIIDEAKGMGIQVMSENELSLIKSDWGKEDTPCNG
jgi:hypothetical protein